MTKIFLIILATLLASASTFSLCNFIVEDGGIYNFYGVPSKSIPAQYGVDSNGTIDFDLCGSSVSGCLASGSDKSDFTAVIASDDDHFDCQNVADSRNPTATYLDPSNPDAGVSLVFPSLANGNLTANILIINVTCNSSISVKNLVWTSTVKFSTTGPNIYTLVTSGSPGCPTLLLQNYLVFFTRYKIYFTVALFLVGFFTLLLGLRFHKTTVFLYSVLLVTIVLFVVAGAITGISGTGTLQWLVFGLCFLVSIFFGVTAVKFQKFGFFAVGAVAGGIAAFFLYSLLLHVFVLNENFMYILIGSFALFAGLLTLWLWEHIIILAMGFIGSYLCVRAISFYTGGFPDELAVVEGLEGYEYTDYIYLGAIILVAILGIMFQFKYRKGYEKEVVKVVEKENIELTETKVQK